MHGGLLVLWMPREGWRPPVKRSTPDRSARDERGVARREETVCHTPLALGVGHHGASRLRSTTRRIVGGRGSGDDRTGRRGVLRGYQS